MSLSHLSFVRRGWLSRKQPSLYVSACTHTTHSILCDLIFWISNDDYLYIGLQNHSLQIVSSFCFGFFLPQFTNHLQLKMSRISLILSITTLEKDHHIYQHYTQCHAYDKLSKVTNLHGEDNTTYMHYCTECSILICIIYNSKINFLSIPTSVWK